MKIDSSKYENYFSKTDTYTITKNNVNTDLIRDTYKTELERQIKRDIEDLGFTISKISFEIDMETGEIHNLILELSKENISKNSNNISINKIEIGKSLNTKESNLSNQEINTIKDKFKNDYGLEYNDIIITCK